jgi:predicted metal-dependent hydrolase
MSTQLHLGEITLDVTLKDIKNIHLSVHPPTGAVRISAPARMSLETIRVYAISRLPWIRQQQRKFREQERETPCEYLDRESHYVWGRRYLLVIREEDREPGVELSHRRLVLRVRPGTGVEARDAVLSRWYREQIRSAAVPLIGKWEPVLEVRLERFFVQRMKTRWGSCNSAARTIRLNTELAKKPEVCLEYIIVHELVHLLEPTHNPRFVALMDRFMPDWRFHRDELNRLPVRHEHWDY